MVKDIIERFEPQMKEAGTPPTLECYETVTGKWDRYRIEQVIVNLLINAMKYGNKKPVKIQVSRHKNTARIRVIDQGWGVLKKDQERIFQRFERAISKDEVSGLGVGLYISEQIVNLHHGRIWVESEPGKGSVFTVEIPLSPILANIQLKESA
jgi:signal transduction histidine kinase